ncbi:Protein containing DUF192 [Alloalcanivorax dieselolei B5]|uniref:Protein containing DUF192 n=1 Tax=Alcanivorax dieselolei (strain DSM 16502 / CGMCC 1.3690 / MCCC 1A00001 / B-5) TaxID=930169 RepID=K0CEV3_ALCDB|nr:Protein containing DUF192 [Alloalcanivorax dieselolei B5]GGJ96243.1 hypothetical protein GCM10007426_26670 [Alloalcanivorax dieselolei]
MLAVGLAVMVSLGMAVEVPPGHMVLCVDGVPQRILVELADTGEERARGLMERDNLGEFKGMLFRYERPQPAVNGFWMFNTHIPLDIAFLGRNGEILTIHTMEPCLHRDPYSCPVYRSAARYSSALEVNAGFFARHGVTPGSRVRPANYAMECSSDSIK